MEYFEYVLQFHHQSIELLLSRVPDQFLPHTRVENQRDIHSYTARLGHVDVAKLIPFQVKPQLMSSNLMACFGHKPMAIDSISATLYPSHFLSRKLVMSCHHYTGYLIVLDGRSSTLKEVLFLILPGKTPSKINLLTKNYLVRYWFSCEWPDYVAGSNGLYGTINIAIYLKIRHLSN